MWIVALATFLLGSILCGAAWSTGSLIGFRVLQGIGGGLLVPIMQTILAQAAGPKGLTRLIGVIAIPITLAPVLGPVLGGLIVSDFSWRWIFYVNVPICLAALVLAWRGLPETTPRPGTGSTSSGCCCSRPALATIIYACCAGGNARRLRRRRACSSCWPPAAPCSSASRSTRCACAPARSSTCACSARAPSARRRR